MKDYKKILKGVVNIVNTSENSDVVANICAYIDENCPELKESEDERIRGAIIHFISHTPTVPKGFIGKKTMLAWLEKQGEQKPTIEMKTPEESLGIDSDTYNKIVDECIYGEQNPANKIEPKFKVGDWVVFDDDHNSVWQVEKIQGLRYYLRHYTGSSMSALFGNPFLRHWNIQDAKDGDVLVASDGSIFLFAGVVDCACEYYVALAADNYVKINKEGGYWETSRAVYPATKEQRDLLFQKMHEAGYEWDAEKKKLSKCVIDEGKPEIDYCFTKMMNGENVSPAWSEEDENMFYNIIHFIQHSDENNTTKQDFTSFIQKLQSLKFQSPWKPSDEQIHAFEQVYDWYNNNFAPSETLTSLYNDLKKLK